MKYSEAIKEIYRKPWKVSTCSQGESCWCRIIESVEPVEYQLGSGEDDEIRFQKISEIVPMGAIDKNFAEHAVKIHNDYLEKKSEIFEAF